MQIFEVTERPVLLIQQLLQVWESAVKKTHLFLSDSEIEEIKKYVPQALEHISHLIIAENEHKILLPLWVWNNKNLKCYLFHRKI